MVNLEKIKMLRKNKAIQGAKLAEMIGISEQTYWSKEGGWRKWKVEELVILSDIYNCTVDDLIIRKEEECEC